MCSYTIGIKITYELLTLIKQSQFAFILKLFILELQSLIFFMVDEVVIRFITYKNMCLVLDISNHVSIKCKDVCYYTRLIYLYKLNYSCMEVEVRSCGCNY